MVIMKIFYQLIFNFFKKNPKSVFAEMSHQRYQRDIHIYGVDHTYICINILQNPKCSEKECFPGKNSSIREIKYIY